MSLKSCLIGKSEDDLKFQDIVKSVQPSKVDFTTLSGNKAFTSEFEYKAPNNLSKPIYSTTVGTAFDYVARFMVAQKIKSDKDAAYQDIVAENFFDRFECLLPMDLCATLKSKFIDSIKSIKEFIYSDIEVDRGLILDACFLARLEGCWRGGRLPEDVYALNEPSYEEIVDDLVNLVDVFKKDFIFKIVREDSEVVFNPKFGVSSMMLGGADADIYIDGVLYDFKSSKKYGYVGKDVQQLMGYYLLYRVCELHKDENCSFATVLKEDVTFKPIHRVAIYLARFGEVAYVDINTIDALKLNSSVYSMFDLLNEWGYEAISKSVNFTDIPTLNSDEDAIGCTVKTDAKKTTEAIKNITEDAKTGKDKNDAIFLIAIIILGLFMYLFSVIIF